MALETVAESKIVKRIFSRGPKISINNIVRTIQALENSKERSAKESRCTFETTCSALTKFHPLKRTLAHLAAQNLKKGEKNDAIEKK